mmetsp:Transcript_6311/g.13730  ORF Transcript_6311/g.13730 Transcript_6311/m.13730 type:complete len:1464 (+) Transcript_6311:110-4501(+)
MPTATPARYAVYSLEEDFDYEASGSRSSSHDNLSPPPPPRDDLEDGNDDADEVNGDGDDQSSMEDHIGHHHHHSSNGNSNNNNDHSSDNDNESLTSPSKPDLDNTLDGCSFGDETMHVLMDAELRLSAVPPSSVKHANFGNSNNGRHLESMSATMTGMEAIGEQQPSHFHFKVRTDGSLISDDGFSTGISVGSNSLLRGPMMAAKSARAIAGMEVPAEAGNSNDESFSTAGSLLRGPLMAAKSSMAIDTDMGGGDTISDMMSDNDEINVTHHTEGMDNRQGMTNDSSRIDNEVGSYEMNNDDHDDTPSKARGEFLSARKPMLQNTPSKAREEFLMSVQKPSNRLESSAWAASEKTMNGMVTTTPSAARSEFLAAQSMQGPGGYSMNAHGMNGPRLNDLANDTNGQHGIIDHVGHVSDKSPSSLCENYVVSTQKKPPRSQQNRFQQGGQIQNENSPSAARDNFLTSPQDSVSTMGNRSPSDAYLVLNPRIPASGLGARASRPPALEEGCVSQQQQFQQRLPPSSHPTPSMERRKFFSSPQDSMPSMHSSNVGGDRYVSETPLSNGSRNTTTSTASRKSTILEKVDQFIDDANQNFSTTKNDNGSSLESMIALGEAQMKLAAAAAEETANTNSHHVTPSLPPKRPFLRKGARREPSSLHKMNNNNSNSVTLSTQQRSNANSNNNSLNVVNDPCANTTPSTGNSNNTNSNANNETLSQRKARLARLEKMQEDLMRDYERRQVRKEEARKDRRTGKNVGNETTSRARSSSKGRQRSSSVGRGNSGVAAPGQMPSRARPPSAGRARNAAVVDVVEEQTPSHARRNGGTKGQTPSHARLNSAQKPSQIRARSVPKKSSLIEIAATNEIITPSQARTQSPAKTRSSAEIVDENESSVVEEYYVAEEYDDDDMEHDCIEGREWQDNNNVPDIAVEEKGKLKPSTVKPPRSKPATRPTQQTSTARRSGSAAKLRVGTQRRNPKGSSSKHGAKSKSSSDEDDKKAFEEWKRKEEEQWALIKNMRKRQEAALREAEGERERAKAWASTEKESVKKWAAEQRALIKKDRHKAANAALIASKKANKERHYEEQQEATNAELEELRAAMKKMKMEAEESRKLKEQIRRQERMIHSLKNAKAGGGMAVPATKSKSPGGMTLSKIKSPSAMASSKNVNPSPGSRRALGDCSSKHNAHQHSRKQNDRRKSCDGENVPKKQMSELVVERDVPVVEEKSETDTLTEEPADHWLQQHLSNLNNANNRLGTKIIDEDHRDSNKAKYHHTNQQGAQRKPYNAADYGGNEEQFPTRSLSRPSNQLDPEVPPFVTPPSPSNHASERCVSGGGDGDGGAIDDHQHAPTKSQIFTYKNGTQKEVLPDGTTTISFANGDRKRTYTNEKKGIVVYYYAATKTTQVTHQDGMQTYHFPNKQIENHYTDGRKEITFPDGTSRMVHTDGSCDTTFADGVRVIDYPDGTQRVIQA